MNPSPSQYSNEIAMSRILDCGHPISASSVEIEEQENPPRLVTEAHVAHLLTFREATHNCAVYEEKIRRNNQNPPF